jgi:hypothetical protein
VTIPTVIIFLEGGVVQDVRASSPVRIIIHDHEEIEAGNRPPAEQLKLAAAAITWPSVLR